MANSFSVSSAPRRQAEYLLEKLGISKPEDIDLDYIAWECGAVIREEDLRGAEGRILKLGKRSLISIKQGISEVGKKRFTIAHELGHLLLRHSRTQFAMCTNADLLSWYKYSPDERDANFFASELLMPEKLFAPRCEKGPSLDAFEALSSLFNSSLTATIIRYVALTSHRVAVVLSDGKYIKWAYESSRFGYEIKPGEPLKLQTYAAEHFGGSDVSRKFEFVEARAWLDDGQIASDAFIRELAIPMQKYDCALSVIWIERDIE